MRPLPKVELHLHLDCSLSHQVVSILDPAVTRRQYDSEFVAPPKCTSLADFLTRAPRGFQLMQSANALKLVTEDVFQQLAADNVLYAELRFAPLLHTQQGLTAEQVVASVDRATESCIRRTGIEARLILCTLRHFTPEESLQTAQLVERFRGTRVVALDIAGDEAAYSIDANLTGFRYAIDHGLARTAHAGEAAGADSVWETLRNFEPSRIGHGVRAIEDAELIAHLKLKRIHLEVCPTSNVQTHVCDRYEDHPVDRLYRAGVSLSINTDARTITNVTLNREYARLRETFGWGNAELLACNREAIRAAFLDDAAKAVLDAQLTSAYSAVPS